MYDELMYLGIEIGGTKLQLGVGAGDGSPMVELRRHDVDIARGAAGILEQIASTGRELIARHGVKRVGFGFGGPIDSTAGKVITSHQVRGWDDWPLAAWCQETLGRPAALGNDCDAAALAEARFGAGRGARTVFYITVGTGIGGGLAIDGRLHGAGRPAVAEIGHLRPGFAATDSHDTIESRAAGPGIAAAALARWRRDPQADGAADLAVRAGGDFQNVTSKDIAAAAQDGNRFAIAVLDEACRALGWAVATVVTLISPEIVVIGGGVSLIGERHFFEPVRRHAATYAFPPLAGAYRIVPAQLGEEVVVHGALALAAS